MPFLFAKNEDKRGPAAKLKTVKILFIELCADITEMLKAEGTDLYPIMYENVRDRKMKKKKTESLMRLFLLCLVPSRKTSTVICGGALIIIRDDRTMDINETMMNKAGAELNR